MMLLLSRVMGLLCTNLTQTQTCHHTSGGGGGGRCGALLSPGGQPEQVVHGVRVVPQAVLLLQQLEGRHAQSLEKQKRP